MLHGEARDREVSKATRIMYLVADVDRASFGTTLSAYQPYPDGCQSRGPERLCGLDATQSSSIGE